MTIFKEKVSEEFVTVAEAKRVLADVEAERAADERELRYELARAIDHTNRFATLEPEEAAELVEELAALEKVEEKTAYKLADLLPQSRDELRAVYAQERFSLSADELDEILDVIVKYA
ncbi:MAG: RNA polymerase Rpb4 family protein [Halobacteriaceae archaeon]